MAFTFWHEEWEPQDPDALSWPPVAVCFRAEVLHPEEGAEPVAALRVLVGVTDEDGRREVRARLTPEDAERLLAFLQEQLPEMRRRIASPSGS